MTNSLTILTKSFLILAVAWSMAAFYTEPADAQTATKLKCKGCVKSKQLKNGGIKNKDLADDVVNGQKIADGTVGTADLGGDSVTGDKILDGAVTGADVQNDSLTGTDVQDNSLNSADVAGIDRGDITDEAGADFDGANEREEITATDETVRSVAISAPSSGVVVVVASGTWDSDASVITGGRCSITTGTTVTTTAASEITLFSDPDEDFTPFALTRAFNVNAGTTTLRLVCDVTIAGQNAFILDAQMTAMFFPTIY